MRENILCLSHIHMEEKTFSGGYRERSALWDRDGKHRDRGEDVKASCEER